jgi:hypothetical protein
MLKGREVDMVIEIEIDTGDKRTYVVLCMFVLVSSFAKWGNMEG